MKEESKFKLVLKAKICNIEEADGFIKDLERKTQCKYSKREREYQGNKGWISDNKKYVSLMYNPDFETKLKPSAPKRM